MRSLLKKPIFLIALFSGIFHAGAQKMMTLTDALSAGLSNNYSIRIAKNEVKVSSNNNTLGNAGMLPSLFADGSYLKRVENINQHYATGLELQKSGAQTKTFAAGVELDWTLFNGFTMFSSYKQLNLLDQAGMLTYKNKVETTSIDIAAAYYNIVREQRQLMVYKDAADLSRTRMELAQMKYEVGSLSKLDYLQARVDLNADSANYIRQQSEVKKAKQELNRIIGRADTADFIVADTLVLLPEMNIGDLNSKLMSANTLIQLASINEKAAAEGVDILKGQQYPSIGFLTRYNLTNQNAQAGFITLNQVQGLSYGLTARWNLFNGMNVRREIENSKIIADNSRLNYESVKNDIQSMLMKAYEDYTGGLSLVRLEQDNMKFAAQNLDIANERYKIGRSNLVEYRQAQISFTEARTRLLNAIYAAKVAEVQLLQLTGQLDKVK